MKIEIDIDTINKLLKVNPENLIKRLEKNKKSLFQTIGLITIYGLGCFLKNEIEKAIEEEEKTIEMKEGTRNEI